MKIFNPILRSLCALIFLLMAACGGSSSSGKSVDVMQPLRHQFSGVGTVGIFDPSIAKDPATSRLWMSYSEVSTKAYPYPSLLGSVGLRLAYSDNQGGTWTDAGIDLEPYSASAVGPLPSFDNTNASIPDIAINSDGLWQSETSTLIYDAGAAANERWKLIYEQYLNANNSTYHAGYSWLALKMAATPMDLAGATAIKLFSSFTYMSEAETAAAVSPTAGSPAIHLPTDLSQLNSLGDITELSTMVFAEPGMHMIGSTLYLATLGVELVSGNKYIVLFSCADTSGINNSANWSYIGRIISPADAVEIGWDSFSAPALFEQAGTQYVVVTPVEATGDMYRGCRVYQFTDISTGALKRNVGVLDEIVRVDGLTDSFNGAGEYHEDLPGLIYSQLDLSASPDIFQIFQSYEPLPVSAVTVLAPVVSQ